MSDIFRFTFYEGLLCLCSFSSYNRRFEKGTGQYNRKSPPGLFSTLLSVFSIYQHIYSYLTRILNYLKFVYGSIENVFSRKRGYSPIKFSTIWGFYLPKNIQKKFTRLFLYGHFIIEERLTSRDYSLLDLSGVFNYCKKLGYYFALKSSFLLPGPPKPYSSTVEKKFRPIRSKFFSICH